MTKQKFVREMLAQLERHYAGSPEPEWQDAVKFIFQGMLGAGHLLSSSEAAAVCVREEMASLSPDPSEPLYEILSPSWCRLNLRRAMAEGIQPEIIAGLMMTSEPLTAFTRRDVYDVCKEELSSRYGALFLDAGSECILNAKWLPSHSDAYKERYHPAYRLIATGWLPCMEAIIHISRKQKTADRLMITLDGPCASGKTTLAEKLSRVFSAALIHTDDYVVPHAQKTRERLAIPGGNCDVERLTEEIVEPWKQGRKILCRKYDCASDCLLAWQSLPDSKTLIIEGCYCNLPPIRQAADVKLFLDAPWSIREKRLRRRETISSLRMFYERWIPLENAYFRAHRLPDENQINITVP